MRAYAINGVLYETDKGQPAASLAETAFVYGELYETDHQMIRKLDAYYADFDRKEVAVTTDAGNKTAFAYVVKPSVPHSAVSKAETGKNTVL